MRLDRLISLYLARPFRRIFRADHRRLPILMYHSISDDPELGVGSYFKVCTSPKRFAEHMQWLADWGYQGVTLSEGLAWLKGSDQNSEDKGQPDDSPSHANTITVNGSAQTHNFYVAGDNDWVKFWGSNGRSYVIETFNLGGFCDTVLGLYDTNGTTLMVYNDDDGGGMDSRISWTVPADGYYYIRVRHYSSSAYGLVTNYDLKVNGTIPPEPPDTKMFFPIIRR